MVDQPMAEFTSKAPVEARAEAFFKSPVGRDLKEISHTTVSIDLSGIPILAKREQGYNLAQLPVSLRIDELLSKAEAESSVLADINRNLAVAFPNVNVGLGYELPKTERQKAEGVVRGMVYRHQEALFLAAALETPGLSWVKMKSEWGLSNPQEARNRIAQLLENKQTDKKKLTKTLLGLKEPAVSSAQVRRRPSL